MAGSGAESGGTPVGGSRRPPRPPLNVIPNPRRAAVEPNRHETRPHGAQPHGTQPIADQAAGQACPWVYLLADPDARAAAVTAEHRCEIRPDEVPGPGHQLAYCLGSNHISCPQLRNYEGQRQAAADAAREQGSPTVPSGAEPAGGTGPPRIERFGRSAAPPRGRSTTIGRVIWTAAGAVGALALAAGLAIYAGPDSLTSDPSAEGESDANVSAAADPTSSPAVTETDPPNDGRDEETTATPTPEPVRPSVYTVQLGDTLGKIARDLGISVVALIEANEITADSVVLVGDELQVPLAGPPGEDEVAGEPSDGLE